MFKKNMFRNLLFVSSALAVSACSYAIDGSYQRVKIETPGAEGSKCHVYVDGLHYPISVPGEISVQKTSKDLEIDCLAPGNRRKKVVVPARVASSTLLNASNGFLGGAWDYASGAMFEFPDVIQVTFHDVPQKPTSGPLHDHPGMKHSSEYFMEEIVPGEPRLNSDRYKTTTPIKRRQRGGAAESETDLRFTFSDDIQAGPAIPPSQQALAATVSAPASSQSVVLDSDFSRFNEDGPVSTFPIE